MNLSHGILDPKYSDIYKMIEALCDIRDISGVDLETLLDFQYPDMSKLILLRKLARDDYIPYIIFSYLWDSLDFKKKDVRLAVLAWLSRVGRDSENSQAIEHLVNPVVGASLPGQSPKTSSE